MAAMDRWPLLLTNRKIWCIVLIVGLIIAVGLLWQQVFMMTGISREQLPPDVQRPVPPEAVTIKPLPTGWVDLEAYQRTHPIWNP